MWWWFDVNVFDSELNHIRLTRHLKTEKLRGFFLKDIFLGLTGRQKKRLQT